MNGINNNVSNSNYGSFGNNGSNNSKDEKSIFDNIVDSVKEFFDGDSENNQFSSYDSKANSYGSNMANIDRAYFNSRAKIQNSYTLAPETKNETLGEKWQKENESAELKQKENQIMQLKQKVGVLENRNKVLSKQNEYMSERMPKSNEINQEVSEQTTMVSNTKEVEQEPLAQTQKPKTYDSIPTHTTMSNDIYEKQQNEIEEFSKNLKAETPEKKDDVDKSKEEVKA